MIVEIFRMKLSEIRIERWSVKYVEWCKEGCQEIWLPNEGLKSVVEQNKVEFNDGKHN